MHFRNKFSERNK